MNNDPGMASNNKASEVKSPWDEFVLKKDGTRTDEYSESKHGVKERGIEKKFVSDNNKLIRQHRFGKITDAELEKKQNNALDLAIKKIDSTRKSYYNEHYKAQKEEQPIPETDDGSEVNAQIEPYINSTTIEEVIGPDINIPEDAADDALDYYINPNGYLYPPFNQETVQSTEKNQESPEPEQKQEDLTENQTESQVNQSERQPADEKPEKISSNPKEELRQKINEYNGVIAARMYCKQEQIRLKNELKNIEKRQNEIANMIQTTSSSDDIRLLASQLAEIANQRDPIEKRIKNIENGKSLEESINDKTAKDEEDYNDQRWLKGYNKLDEEAKALEKEIRELEEKIKNTEIDQKEDGQSEPAKQSKEKKEEKPKKKEIEEDPSEVQMLLEREIERANRLAALREEENTARQKKAEIKETREEIAADLDLPVKSLRRFRRMQNKKIDRLKESIDDAEIEYNKKAKRYDKYLDDRDTEEMSVAELFKYNLKKEKAREEMKRITQAYNKITKPIQKEIRSLKEDLEKTDKYEEYFPTITERIMALCSKESVRSALRKIKIAWYASQEANRPEIFQTEIQLQARRPQPAEIISMPDQQKANQSVA